MVFMVETVHVKQNGWRVDVDDIHADTNPGVPKNYLDPKKLVTDDCIRQ
jgi:hypothetical protein